jgi:uncharacterized membrane protein
VGTGIDTDAVAVEPGDDDAVDVIASAATPPAPGADAVDPDRPTLGDRLATRWRNLALVHPSLWLVWFGAALFAVLFGALGVANHRNFGTWSFDMGIYDQGFWLVSRGKSWNTVRGIDMWGHHVNLIAVAFAPFYWLGAGPSFLYVVQATVLGLGAVPAYLIARDRLRSPWAAAVIAAVYLMYAPVQWIAWANFHPEALVITPLLFAWWHATRRNWRWAFGCLLIALSTREDTAMAVFMMGLVLWLVMRRSEGAGRRDRLLALAVAGLGVLWYLVTMRIVIPAFNRGQQPFYISSFYANYGENVIEIARTIVTRPDRVVSDGTQTDRLRFYRDLMLPWGGMPLGGPVQLLMALPQMLASVIGLSPYARSIRYQYTSVMIAPIVIAAIEGVALAFRYHWSRRVVLPWLLVCAYVSNVAWSPSPISANDEAWARPTVRHDAMRTALGLVPDDASVTATYSLLPHLSHREQIYDWPNPWIEAYWGNDDGYRLPDPSSIDFLVLDLQTVGTDKLGLVDELTATGGEFEVLFEQSDVLVAQRVAPPVAD